MERKPVVRLAYLLPILELLICWTIAIFAMPDMGSRIRASFGPRPVQFKSQGEQIEEQIAQSRSWALTIDQATWVFNMPGMWAEMLTSIKTWPDSWSPSGFADLFAWRIILWPVGALPFWFSVGRGVDYFLYRSWETRRVGWFAAVLALLSASFGALTCAVGLSDNAPVFRSPRMDNSLAVAGSVWFVLGGITCCAVAVQWRNRRLSRKLVQGA